MGWTPQHKRMKPKADAKRARRTGRFRSKAHLEHVRSQPCCICGAYLSRACHLRIGTDGGMAVKPSDYFTTPMCDRCHGEQHRGERTFWQGLDPMAIIEALIRTSPVRREIEAHRAADNA